jgi:hypothetical protein
VQGGCVSRNAPVLFEIHTILFEVKKFLTSNYLDKPLFGCYTALRTGEMPPFLFAFSQIERNTQK